MTKRLQIQCSVLALAAALVGCPEGKPAAQTILNSQSGAWTGVPGAPGTPGTPGAGVAGAGGGLASAPGAAGEAGAGGVALDDGQAGAPAVTGPGRSYIDLSPPMGAPFDPAQAVVLTPPAPTGWDYQPVDGAVCRDGSPLGVYVRDTGADKLLIYFEGGGACSTFGFCNYNPPNTDSSLSGDGQTVIGSTFGVAQARQQPGVYEAGALKGIFDETNPANPFSGWNMIYIPYCTGDVHFGTNDNAMVPGVSTPQKMVGHLNTKKIIGRAVPTFGVRIDRVVLTGASAGSFGAALNASMVADAFKGVRMDAILDSGVPFADEYWPACIQQSWRDLFGLDAAFPQDCQECFHSDGGGMLGLADFLIDKHPDSTIAAISAVHDEVIRLFFAPSQNDCAEIETADPVFLTAGQLFGGGIYPAPDYEAALMQLRERYQGTGRFSTYFMAGANEVMHQHTFRQRFYETAAGGKTIAAFVQEHLDGSMAQVGP